jgi:hypothetical protein
MYRGFPANHRRSAPPRIVSEQAFDLLGSKREDNQFHHEDVGGKEKATSSSAAPLNVNICSHHQLHNYSNGISCKLLPATNPIKRSSLPNLVNRGRGKAHGNGDRDDRPSMPTGSGVGLWSDDNGDESILTAAANRGTSPLRAAAMVLIASCVVVAVASFAAGAYCRTRELRLALEAGTEQPRDLDPQEPLLEKMYDGDEGSEMSRMEQVTRQQDELSDLHDQLRAAENALIAERDLLQLPKPGSPRGPSVELDDRSQHNPQAVSANDVSERDAGQGSGGNTDEDSVVRKLMTTIGADQYGKGPIWVEFHLEYSSHAYVGGRSRATILRTRVTAQLSLADRPVTSFVFLRQVKHGLYDHVPLTLVGGANAGDSYPEILPGQVFMKVHVLEVRKTEMLELGLAWIPARERSTRYTDQFLEKMDNGSEPAAHEETAHYHLGLDEQGGLFVTSKSYAGKIDSQHERGIFATIIHGEFVLDELRERDQQKFSIASDRWSSTSTPPILARIVSTRLLASLDDRELKGGHNDDDFVPHDEF